MTKQQLDGAFKECVEKCMPQAQESFFETLRVNSDDADNLSPEAVSSSVFVEAIKYANHIVYALFEKLLVDAD